MKRQLLFTAFCIVMVFCVIDVCAQRNETASQKTEADTTGPKRRTAEDRAEGLINRLKDKLSLEEDQIPKVKEIFTRQEKAIEKYFEDMRKLQEKMVDELATVLDSLQLQKFKDIQGRRVPPPPSASPPPIKPDSLRHHKK